MQEFFLTFGLDVLNKIGRDLPIALKICRQASPKLDIARGVT